MRGAEGGEGYGGSGIHQHDAESEVWLVHDQQVHAAGSVGRSECLRQSPNVLAAVDDVTSALNVMRSSDQAPDDDLDDEEEVMTWSRGAKTALLSTCDPGKGCAYGGGKNGSKAATAKLASAGRFSMASTGERKRQIAVDRIVQRGPWTQWTRSAASRTSRRSRTSRTSETRRWCSGAVWKPWRSARWRFGRACETWASGQHGAHDGSDSGGVAATAPNERRDTLVRLRSRSPRSKEGSGEVLSNEHNGFHRKCWEVACDTDGHEYHP